MKELLEGGLDQKILTIKKYACLPWLLYMTSTLALFVLILKPDSKTNSETYENNLQYAFSSSTLILICY